MGFEHKVFLEHVQAFSAGLELHKGLWGTIPLQYKLSNKISGESLVFSRVFSRLWASVLASGKPVVPEAEGNGYFVCMYVCMYE